MSSESTLRPPQEDEGWLRDAALVIIFGALLIVPSFFTRDLWNPDEPRYLEVAREMVVRGDYLVPHLDNVFYPDKPPLFFWLTAGLYNLGAGNISGRIVAGSAMLGTLLLIYAFGRRRFGARTGLLAALVTATSLLFFGLLKTGVIDPLLTFLETGAILSGYCALTGDKRRALRWWLLFYALCGLAMLAKGPVGLLIPVLVTAVFALFHRRSVSFGGWAHAAGVALMLLIFCAWLFPAMARGGEEYSRAILGMPVNYTTASANHAHGPHYYLLLLPVYLFPWTFIFALALAQGLRDWRANKDRDTSFLSLWFLVILAFFTAVSAKRERYLLPLMPAAGLLCARYLILAAEQGLPWPALHRRLLAALYVLMGLAGAVLALAPFIGKQVALDILNKPDQAEMLQTTLTVLSKPFMLALTPLGVLITLTALLGLTTERDSRKWLIGSCIGIAIAVSLLIDLALVPAVNPAKSGKAFGARVLPYLQEADEKYLFNHEYSGVINLYTGILDIPIIEISLSKAEGGAKNGKKGGRDARVVETLMETFSHPGKIAVVSDEKQVAAFLNQLPGGVKVVAKEQIGHRGMICLANWELESGGQTTAGGSGAAASDP